MTLTRFAAGLPFLVIFFAGALVMTLGGWESIAIWTRAVPTISHTTAAHWSSLGAPWKVVVLLVAGVVLGALLVHFTGWRALPGTAV